MSCVYVVPLRYKNIEINKICDITALNRCRHWVHQDRPINPRTFIQPYFCSEIGWPLPSLLDKCQAHTTVFFWQVPRSHSISVQLVQEVATSMPSTSSCTAASSTNEKDGTQIARAEPTGWDIQGYDGVSTGEARTMLLSLASLFLCWPVWPFPWPARSSTIVDAQLALDPRTCCRDKVRPALCMYAVFQQCLPGVKQHWKFGMPRIKPAHGTAQSRVNNFLLPCAGPFSSLQILNFFLQSKLSLETKVMSLASYASTPAAVQPLCPELSLSDAWREGSPSAHTISPSTHALLGQLSQKAAHSLSTASLVVPSRHVPTPKRTASIMLSCSLFSMLADQRARAHIL